MSESGLGLHGTQKSSSIHLDLWSASAPEKTPQMWEMSPKGLSDVSDACIESLIVHCKSQAQDRRRVDSLCYARCGTCCSRASSQHFWGSEWHPSRSAPWPAEVWMLFASNWNKTAPVTLRQEKPARETKHRNQPETIGSNQEPGRNHGNQQRNPKNYGMNHKDI